MKTTSSRFLTRLAGLLSVAFALAAVTPAMAAKPTVTSPTSASVTTTTATLGGNITAANPALSASGVVYSVTSVNSNPQIGGTGVTTNATGPLTTGVFTVPVTGLTSGTGYSFAAYATNNSGTSYSPVGTFTTVSNNANLSNLSLSTGTLVPVFASGTTSYTASVSGATTSITVTPTAAQGNATITVNAVTVASGSPSGSISLSLGNNTITTVVTAQDGVTTKTYTVIVTRADPPSVTTPTNTSVTGTTATLGGNVTSDGGATVTARGVVYSVTATNSNPQLGGTGVTNAPTGGTTGVFTVPVSSLTPGTAYSFAAYATNSAGSGYTSVGTFTTLSNDATLSNLTLSAGTLVPVFASGTTSYTASVLNAVTSITVTPTAAQAGATITVNSVTVTSGSPSGSIALSVGANTITTVVTAQDGITTDTYIVTVTRLAVPTVTSPTSTAITGTSATLGGDVTSDGGLTVTARGVVYSVTATNSNPQLGGTGVTNATTGGTTGNFTVPVSGLTPGTAYSFAAYATNSGGTAYSSTATFTTLSNDATLSNLTLSSGTLVPVFASGTTSYTATVSGATSSITVTPTVNQPGATVQVQVNGGGYASVTSGSPSGSLALNVGTNPVDVKVTAQDGIAIDTYTVTVTRLAAAPTVTTPTSTAVTSLTATLGGNVTSDGGATVTVRGVVYSATATNSNPQIGGTGVTNVTTGGTTGVFTVGVTGLTPATAYTFAAYATNSGGTSYSSTAAFTAQPASDDLSALSLSVGTLNPVFDSSTINYTAVVPLATASITVTPTLVDPLATLSAQVNGGGYAGVTSGSPSGPLALNVGSNTVQVKVVSADTLTTTIYTVTVTRGISVVYVDPSFTSAGALVADADSSTPGAQPAVVGTTAFSTISAGVTAVDPSGTVRVNAATYTESVNATSKVVTLAAGTAAVVVNGNLTLNGSNTLSVDVNGEVAGTSYGQWSVTGTVTLGGATLSYSGSNVPVTGQVFDVVHNTGVSAISGTFSGLAEGAVISSFMGSSLPAKVTYLGGSGHDATITVLGTSVTSGGQLVITNPPGGGGNSDLTMTLTGGGTTLQIHDPNNQLYAGPGATQVDPNTITIPLASITAGLVLNGTSGDDVFTLDFSGGNPIPPGGIVINGGAGTDVLRVAGTSLIAAYTPDASTNGNGVVVFTGANAGTVTFTGLEPVDFNVPGGSFTLIPPSASNVIDVADGFLTDLVTPALVISGTSGGVGFESAHVRGAAITIDSSGFTGSADTVTVTSADNAHTDTSLTITTGNDVGDSIAVNGAVVFAGPVSLAATTVTVAATGSVTTTGAGTITIRTDALTINPAATLSSAATVTLKQINNGTLIDLGGANAPGTLGLSDAELDRVSTPTLNIGDTSSGAITVSAPISRSLSTVVNLTSGSTIALNNLLDSAGGNVTLNGTTITPAATGTDVSMSTTGTLAFGPGTNLALAIGGTTADSGYTQLNVVGHVNLTGATLALSGAYVPAPTDFFTIVSNDGAADAVTGTFDGLAQGGTFAFNGKILAVHYDGGDGNDVVLSVPPVLNSITPPATGTYDVGEVLTFTANYSKTVTVNTAGGTPYMSLIVASRSRHAVYASGSGTASLVFQYTVQNSDNGSVTLSSPIVLNGGTMVDIYGNPAPLSFTPPDTSGIQTVGTVLYTAGAGSDAAPGTVAGGPTVGTWDSIRSGMVMASNGAIAFRAHLALNPPSVTVNDYQGIWKSPDGTSTTTYLLARTGSDAPDTGSPDAVFDLLPLNPYINRLGQTSFVGFLRVGTGVGPVTDSTNAGGIWTEVGTGSNGLRLLLRQGESITEGTVTMVAPSGWVAVSNPATTSGPGYAAFNVQLDGNTATPSSALMRMTIATVGGVTTVTPAALAVQGGGAPDFIGGTTGAFDAMYGNSNDPRMDEAGNVAFLGYLQDGNSGIWYQTVAGAMSAVARTGEATPGLADTFIGFERPSLAASSATFHIAFRAFMTTISQAVWAGNPETPGALVAIAKTGDTALPGIPGGSKLWSIWSPFSNASGKVAFRVSLLDGASVETRAIVTDTDGTLRVIAKAGDAAPGVADTFANFDHPIIGNGNQAAFSASTLGGTTGIWKQAAGGGALSLVLKVGDTITTEGITKTIAAFVVIGTASSDRLNEVVSMDATGRILVWVVYDTGDTGILLTVP